MYKSGKQELLSKDALKITKFRTENPDLSIDETIEKVLKLKPVSVTNYMIVCEAHEKLKKFIENNNDYEEKLLKILRENMEGSFYEINTSEAVIAILLDEKAYSIFNKEQEENGNPFTDYLNNFLEDKIE